MNIRTIQILPGGRRVITTDDDAEHYIGVLSPADVSNHEVGCGDPYPFEDDEAGNAVAVLPPEPEEPGS